MVDEADDPEIIECQIQLHSSRPAGPRGAEPSWAEWSQSAVGSAVTFQAIAKTAKGAWNGPLSPGVDVAAPVVLDDPYWTVFLPRGRGLPIVTGRVGRRLTIGEAFTLPPGEPGSWTTGVSFDGVITVD